MKILKLFMSPFLILFLVLTTQDTLAERGSPHERISEFYSLQRTLYDDNGKAHLLPYSFYYRAPKNGAPTLIYIPGGPGSTSAELPISNFMSIPADYGVLQTDPPFTGINKLDNFAVFSKAMSSTQIAQDISAVITALKVDKPIIYGFSYGTVAATILADLLSATKNIPHAIILDGTVAKAISQRSYQQTFINEWRSFLKTLPPLEAMKFLSFLKNLVVTRKFSPDLLGTTLQTILMLRNQGDHTALLHWIATTALHTPQNAENILQQISQNQGRFHLSEAQSLLRRMIICNEWIPDASVRSPLFTFTKDFEALENPSDCRSLAPKPMPNLYDAKKYRSKAPIIYLQGELDPATPLDQAMYHFNSQTSTTRHLLLAADGGHGVIGKEMRDCNLTFFKILASDVNLAAHQLATCMNNVKLLSAEAQ